MNVTNQTVPTIIDHGGTVSGYARNFWGEAGKHLHLNPGYMGTSLARVLLDLAKEHEDGITGVIYSYRTPVAIRIGEVWLAPDNSYSATTSSKHQSQLYRLRKLSWIPGDAGIQELRSIIAGDIVYIRGGEYRKGQA